MDDLLILTTAGNPKWVKEAISTMRDPMDILVIDDATPDVTEMKAFCKARNIGFITKKQPKGVTHSWNVGYQHFRAKKYKNCILSNNDVRFAKGFSNELFKGLQAFNVVGPLSNQPGAGKRQRIESFTIIKPTSEVKNIDIIQKAILNKYSANPFREVGNVNGFCFAFSHSIERFMFSDDLLINPGKINVGNEDDLARRIRNLGGKMAMCRISYVFHWKAITLRRQKNRQFLWRR